VFYLSQADQLKKETYENDEVQRRTGLANISKNKQIVSGLQKDIPGKLDVLLGGHAPPAHDNAAHYSSKL